MARDEFPHRAKVEPVDYERIAWTIADMRQAAMEPLGVPIVTSEQKIRGVMVNKSKITIEEPVPARCPKIWILKKMSDLNMRIKYDVRTDVFEIEANAKSERLKDIIGYVVRSMIGAGTDDSPVEQRDTYTVDISIDLSCDEVHVSSDCGNKDLETGIIAAALLYHRRGRNVSVRKGMRVSYGDESKH